MLSAVPAATAQAASVSSSEITVLDVMNSTRRRFGLRPLRVDPRLQLAANAQTRSILVRGVLAHGSFGKRMRSFRIRARLAGENLAWTTAPDTATEVVGSWLRSPEHRANLLSPVFTRAGIAVAFGSFAGAPGTAVVTADFAG